MKVLRFLCLVLLVCSLSVVIAADRCSAQTTGEVKKFVCAKDRAGITFCKRVAPAGRFSGQEGVYADRSATGKSCKWKCKTAQGVETCQGSGSECTGKTPPHFR